GDCKPCMHPDCRFNPGRCR
nr:Chain A, Conotoxin Bt14.16 [Conus betulinus]